MKRKIWYAPYKFESYGEEEIKAAKFHTIEEVAAKDVPAGANHEIVEDGDVPSDRTFRDAWTWA